MDRYIVKNLILCSLVVGLLFGLLSAIPFLGLIMLFAVLLLTAPIVMLFLIVAGKYDISDEKNSIITGTITGFSANITYCAAFCTTIVLLYTFANYNPNLFLTAMIKNSPVWLLIVCILFVGVVTATLNAFTGFITYYILNLIRDIYAKNHNE